MEIKFYSLVGIIIFMGKFFFFIIKKMQLNHLLFLTGRYSIVHACSIGKRYAHYDSVTSVSMDKG
jgi:hypothetical protein